MLNTRPLSLLVIDDSSNDAEIISNMLRNAGHAVHTTRIEDDEDLREALNNQVCDMILAKPELPYFTATEALDVIAQSGKATPLLLIADGLEEEKATELLKAGALDVVFLTQPARLLHAVLREAQAAEAKRSLLRCEALLEATNLRAQNLVDSSRDAITYIHEGMYIYANSSYLEMFGYSDMNELEGMPILNMVKSEDHVGFKAFLRDYMSGKAKASSFELTGLRSDGSDFDITMELSNASYDGEPCTQIIIRAQANSEELEKRLEDMSKLDLLTGVFNRQYFLDELHQVIGKPGKQGAVLYIQPDHFKQLRDDLGLAHSDQLLSEMAKALKHALGEGEHFIARFEGEYFCALLKNVDQNAAETITEALSKAVDAYHYQIDTKTIAVTGSIGIALYNEGTEDSQSLLQRADKAMREAARQGGNHYHTYIPGEDEMAEQERTAHITQRIKDALRNNQMHLLFQPIVSIKGDKQENYEAFARMQDEHGQAIPPNEFIPAAEKANLMPVLDRWVLAYGIKAVTQHRKKGHPAVLFVKLSGASLRDEKFLPWLRDIIKAAHAEPGSLVLSVSEDVASTNLKSLKQLIEGLQQLHVKLALDHFGQASNYANLLKHCNAHYLKLHASLIGDLAKNPEATEKVREITGMAAESHKLVIANAVEDPHTLALIYSTGIDYIQGYFLQEPSPQMDYDFSSMG
ncbi:MAG: EAL domain-containing protein [Chromatiales bacterium]|nr:EAL domain-containing protein [Chromatiales bacterium]